MNDKFLPYESCLRQPMWPDSDPRALEQMIPTGTPQEGCPIGYAQRIDRRMGAPS
jgi:hypothetical protein